MKTFTASRVSDGNGMFPCKIMVGGNKITVRIPGLFRNQDKDIAFDKISEVSVETPLVGYSTIIFYTSGIGYVKAHGFTKSEVKEIKRLIESGDEDSEANESSVSEEERPVHYRTIAEIDRDVEEQTRRDDDEYEREQTTSRSSRRVREDDNSEEDNLKKERADLERQKLAFEREKFNREKGEYERKEIVEKELERDSKYLQLAQIVLKKLGIDGMHGNLRIAFDILSEEDDVHVASNLIKAAIKKKEWDTVFPALNRKNKPEAIKAVRKLLPEIDPETDLETKKSALRCLEELNRKYSGIEISPRTLSIASALRNKYNYEDAKNKMLYACGPLNTKK